MLQYLKLSVFNFALWSYFIYRLLTDSYFDEHPARAAATWFVIFFVGPLVFGVGLGLIYQWNLPKRVLGSIGFTMLSSIPTSWDHVFLRFTNTTIWVLVTLKDDTRVAGFWGPKSYASSDPNERDIYIEQVYRVTESGPWELIERSSGILIPVEEIRYIEFRTGRPKEESE